MNLKFWKKSPPLDKPKGKRAYGGAMVNRLTQDWLAQSTSYDTELRTSLRALRNRSRQLVRDNDYARNAIRLIRNNVIGTGIQLQAQVTKRRGTGLDTKTNAAIEKAWRKWCKRQSCDVAGKMSFHDIQRKAVTAVAVSGEVFIRKIYQSFGGSTIPIALEVIEADLCPEERNGRADNGNEIRMGVEVDQWQRPVAYWFYPHHPGDFQFAGPQVQKMIRIPADEIIHLHVPTDRTGETRGEPWLCSTLKRLHNMGGYEEAEIVAARAQASIVGFIETPDGDYAGADGTETGYNGLTDRATNMEPGEIQVLSPGEKFTGFAPTRPGGQYDPFMRFMLRGMASGLGISYESLSRDFSQSNYSSSRLAILEDRDNYKILQHWICEWMLQNVYESWLEMAVLSGQLALPGYEVDPDVYTTAVRWKPRGWSWIDPGKEVEAYQKAVRNGFMTQADVLDLTGGMDFEDFIVARKAEVVLYKKNDLVFDSDPSQTDDKGKAQAIEPSDAGGKPIVEDDVYQKPGQPAEPEGQAGNPDENGNQKS